MLQKFDKLVDKFERLIPNMEPNFECFPYWRKVGCLLETDLGIFVTRFKGQMWRMGLVSIERGKFKCSGRRKYMDSYVLTITDTFSKLSRYVDKALWGWQAKQDTGDCMKHF